MALIVSIARLGFSNGLTTLCLFLLLLLLAALCVHRTFYSRPKRFMELASKIPGPKEYPFIGSAYAFGTHSKDILQNVSNICAKYGKVFKCWVGPELYIGLQDAKDVEVILTNNRLINKPSAYKLMRLGIGDGILVSSGAKWKKHRKALRPTFSYAVYQSYIDVFNEKMRLLMDVLEQQVDKDCFNISHFLHNTVIDILWETILTTKSNTLVTKKGTQDRFSEAINALVSITLCRMFKPWLFIDSIFNKTANGRVAQSHVTYLHDKVKQVIYGKRGSEVHDKIKDEDTDYKTVKQKTAFLEYTLEHASENKLTDEDILDETYTILFAGFDSTASTLAFICCILSRRFDVQEKIVEEIKEVFGSLEYKPFTYFDFERLEYMDRVLKECQRVLSTIPFIARQLTEDIQLPSGYTLPEGSAVFLPFFRIHRDPTYYPNPDVFDPDNFLPERVAARPTYSFCPFSAGPRDCIGKKYAMLQLQGGLLNILRRFWITPTDRKVELAAKMNMHPVNGIHIGLKKRTAERPVIEGMEEMSKYLLTNLDYLNIRFKDSYL